jgi:hypothetical protein
MMKVKINQLSQKDISDLMELFEVLVFPHDFILCYENHIPNVGIALIEGSLELAKKSEIITISEATIFGINYILDDRPVKMECRIKKNSKVILLGKSQLIKRQSKLTRLMKKLGF